MNSVAEINYQLRILPCLSGLGDEDLTVLSQKANLRRIAKNDVLFKESDEIKFFFVIREGAIKLFKTSKDGRELIIKMLKEGDYFCCAPLLTDGRSLVNAVAVENTTVVAIPEENFKEVIENGMSETGFKMLKGLCRRIKYLSGIIEDITFKDVEQRVALVLLRLAEERQPEEDGIVYLSVTHHDIASMAGTVREVVSRTMSRLKKEEVIMESAIRGLKIDKEKLKSFLTTKQ